MNNRGTVLALLFALIACLSFIMGLYFKSSFLQPAPNVSMQPGDIPIASEQVLTEDQVRDKGSSESEVQVQDDGGVSESEVQMEEEPTPDLTETEKTAEDTTLNLNVSHLFGFIKEVNSTDFTLEFLTAQFSGLENQRFERTFVVSDNTFYISKKIFPFPSLEELSKQDEPVAMGGIIVLNDKGEEEKMVVETAPTDFSSLKKGDYVAVVADIDLYGDTSVEAQEVRLYPLDNNPYLNGNFDSYQGLPMDGF